MIHTDSAVEMMREIISKLNLEYNILNLDEKIAKLGILANGLNIPIWFDAQKQLFGFDMIQGGYKTYSDVSEFENFLTTYVMINTIFLPTAKLIADTYESVLNINSVYDNFSGDKQSGYVAHFKVLNNSEQAIMIQKVTEGYSAKLVSYSEDGTKYKVIKEYKYEVSKSNEITVLPTIYYYIDTISEKYDEAGGVDIDRIGVDEFLFTIEDLKIQAKVEFVYTSIIYHISKINDFETEMSIQLDDPYELTGLYFECKTKYDDNNPVESAEEQQSITEDIVESHEEDVSELDENMEESHVNTEDLADHDVKIGSVLADKPSLHGVDSLKDIEDTSSEAHISEVVQSEREIDESSDPEDMKISMIEDRAIQFVTKEGIFTMSIDKATDLGIPVNRIAEKAECVTKHGIIMTVDEISLKTFSKDISKDNEMCKKILNMMFE